MNAWQEEPLQAWGVVAGVALIMVLLWCIGTVAQGQVQRGQARGQQQLHAQAALLRCGQSLPARQRSLACAPAAGAAEGTAVAVVYH